MLEHLFYHTLALIAAQRRPEWKYDADVAWTETELEQRGMRMTFWYREWVRALEDAGAIGGIDPGS